MVTVVLKTFPRTPAAARFDETTFPFTVPLFEIDEGKLFGYNIQGFWYDVGQFDDYLKANHLLLKKHWQNQTKKKTVRNQVKLHPPFIIGKDVKVGIRSEIGSYTTIGNHVTLGQGVCIENSIIFPRTIISEHTSIRGSIIGEGVFIGKQVKIGEGCVIGDHTKIKDNITFNHDVIVCPFKEVNEDVLSPKCLM